jgi:hypothetical protein
VRSRPQITAKGAKPVDRSMSGRSDPARWSEDARLAVVEAFAAIRGRALAGDVASLKRGF